ncbi:hypothetical protein SBOR_2666 [Sclerotinia borealis F-4128]|uniref:Uncharacterized protein n=1 Tax=Sclerotinia borealis (strain F-4128) TaxID=1432307 RepID=W9CM84_SCLBF|nr:hypothetical protein SBOR_2666 [Sclerotinia borealis F-4128]
MSDNIDQYQYLWDDQSQILDQVELHSPVYPADYDQTPRQDPSTFTFEQFLNDSVEKLDDASPQVGHQQADGRMANMRQANHTQVELPVPFMTNNVAVDPRYLNSGFTGNNNPVPAAVSFAGPSNILSANNMQAVQHFPAPFEYAGTYRHDILNVFPSPTYPLHIIDSLGHLPPNVMEALHQGLKRRREYDDQLDQLIAEADNTEPISLEQPSAKKCKVSKGKGITTSVALDSDPEAQALTDTEPESEQKKPEVVVRPTKVPGKKWIKPNLTTQGKNKRSQNIQLLNPSAFYTPHEQQPRSWGNPNHAGVVPFQYTPEGELNPHVKLTADQLREFIFNHPGHNITGERHTKRSGLTLWIQSVPSDSAARYPHQNSDKCRFVDCPVRNGTIHKGHYRVAFDEQSSDPVVHDPFHNAGHVHLFCLEKFLNFPYLCANFNIQPDDRILPEGRNKMAITRDHVEMKKIVRRFVRNAEREYANPNMVINNYSYENTLSYRLTAQHLELEPANRQSLRDRRPNANSIDKHMNNLDIFVAGNNQRRQATQGRSHATSSSDSELVTPIKRPTPAKSNKRKTIEVDEEQDAEFEIDDKILDLDPTQAQIGSSTEQSNDRRPVKRARHETKSAKTVVDSDSYESGNSDDDTSEDDVLNWAVERPVKKSRRSTRKSSRLSR